MTIKESKKGTKDGLPVEAFALAGDQADPCTWHLPHHSKAIFQALTGRFDMEKTVDWDKVEAAVAVLSPRKHGEKRLEAGPEAIIGAARHLASHYQKAAKPLPDILAALI